MAQTADKIFSGLPLVGLVLLGVVVLSASGLAQVATPESMPRPNWPSSKFHGVPDGATGKPIPCRCLFKGEAFQLGAVVCMNTAKGTVLTMCDLVQNTTSWVPSTQACTTSFLDLGLPQMRRFSLVSDRPRLPLE
jgi:hypothetical protein